MDGITIRTETAGDHRIVENVIREAFWNVYSPGACEHFLLHNLRKSPDFIAPLAGVAEANERIVGAVACAEGHILTDDRRQLTVVTVGPLGVLPAMQRRGIGRMLIERTAKEAARMGYHALMLSGDPAYYSLSGFVTAASYDLRTADNMLFDALLVRELTAGWLKQAAGTYHESPDYAVDSEQMEAFDAAFEPKERISDTPSQIRFKLFLATIRPRE